VRSKLDFDIIATMDGSTPSSFKRRQPLDPHGSLGSQTRTTSLNDRLNTDYVDVGCDENSIMAQVTKGITGFVGRFITPRHLPVVLRVLKAVMFCFLILTVAADLMYIVFLEVLASKEVRTVVGGHRDMIIRVYGLILSLMAILVELDVTAVMKSFYGFKGFIPRALLLFFISAITGAHPLYGAKIEIGDDDANYDDYANYDDEYSTVSSEIPQSAVVFQMVTSFVL
jgi:hypothetical protein